MSKTLTSKTIVFAVLLIGGCLMAPAQDQSQPAPKDGKGKITAQGCVTRQSGDYILMQTDPGNSYVLHGSKGVKLGQYLGQQVEVSGTQSPTLADSSNVSQRRSGSSVMITVATIKTISQKCTDQ